MVTKIVVILIIAAVVVGGLLLANYFGLWPFGRGSGDGDGTMDSPVTDLENTEDVEVVERPPSLLIEIREDEILYDNNVIGLGDLENILQEYQGSDYVWTLQDTYRADKSTYDDVKNLLERYDMVFRER